MGNAERRDIDSHRARMPLTDDDLGLLAALSAGLTLDAIAGRFGISPQTARRRFRTICDKLDVDTPVEAVVWATRHRLI